MVSCKFRVFIEIGLQILSFLLGKIYSFIFFWLHFTSCLAYFLLWRVHNNGLDWFSNCTVPGPAESVSDPVVMKHVVFPSGGDGNCCCSASEDYLGCAVQICTSSSSSPSVCVVVLNSYKHGLDGLYRVLREEGAVKLMNGATMASSRATLMTIGQVIIGRRLDISPILTGHGCQVFGIPKSYCDQNLVGIRRWLVYQVT